MDNRINMFMHCKDCLREIPEGVSPRDYSAIEVGLTGSGEAIQIWCRRHEKHVAVFDLAHKVEAHCHECMGEAH